ncbi:hypothetical protein JCM10212_007053 [Sporobolomyces blumeae]
MMKAFDAQAPVYVNTGPVRPPNLSRDYALAGWEPPGVVWTNFKPPLLKLTFVEKTERCTLHVIDIKSTHPDVDVPNGMFQDERFKLQAYRFFLRRLIDDMIEDASVNDLFRRFLVKTDVSRTLTVLRYKGCFANQCRHDGPPCFLNRGHDVTVDQLETLLKTEVKIDPRQVKSVLFRRIPRLLGVEEEVLRTGYVFCL